MASSVKQLFELLKADSSAKQQLAAAKDANTFANIAVQIGSRKGITLSVADVKNALRQAVGGSRELSDAELDAVAGAGDLDFLDNDRF
jgi:hypothetical protein